MSEKSRQPIRFGAFEFDPAARELRASGRPVPLQDQPFRILGVLLARRGEVVAREDLRREIWGDDVHVDFDRSLNTAVARLRDALGDTPTAPVYIETVPRKGYRFIAPVAAPAPLPKHRPATTLLLAAAALAMVAAYSYWTAGATRESPRPFPAPERLTSYLGEENEPTFSPDGSHFAFTWNGAAQDNYDIYVRGIAGGEPFRLTNHPNRDSSPVWSPDGQWIAFGRRMDDGSVAVLRKHPFGGSEDRVLLLPRQGDDGMEPRAMAWAPDSKRLVIVERLRDQNDSLVFSLDLDSGSRRTVLKSRNVMHPRLSPDGRNLAYTDYNRGCFVLPLSDTGEPIGDPKRVELGQSCFSPVWTPDGTRLVMEVGFEASPPGLWSSKPDGSDAKPLPAQAVDYIGSQGLRPAVGPRGLVAFRQELTRRFIWRLDLKSGEARPLIAASGRNDDATYSPDGGRILFRSNRGPAGLWTANADGSEQSLLVEGGADGRWSLDGTKIAFRALWPGNPTEAGPQDIWVMDAHGGPPANLTETLSSRAAAPLWSRDGKWIYFSSGDNLRPRRMPSTGGQSEILKDVRAVVIDQSHDGRWLYLAAGSSRGTMVSRLGPDGDQEVLLEEVIGWSGISVAAEGLYYQAGNPDSGYEIRFYRFTDRSSAVVYRMEGKAGTTLDLSPDGRYLLFAQSEKPQADLMLFKGADW